jgi:excisionase family DNA binding protein
MALIMHHPTNKQFANRRASDVLFLDKRLTANQVADMLGLHVETIYKWARQGRIPCTRLRHRLRFKHSDIERWLAQHTTGKF